MSDRGVDPVPSTLRRCAAEAVGTFMLVLFGVGSVHVAVLTGSLVGIWQVAMVWGIGIALAIYVTGAVSGAHLNPAVSVAMAFARRLPWRMVLPYIAAQLVGAILAGALLFGLFHTPIAAFEASKGIVRGAPGSELSAMMYGEYFPNPGMLASAPALANVSVLLAMLAEAVGACVLVFVIFALTDDRNEGRPDSRFALVLIGLTVSCLIALLAPLSQAGFNPARDFGPRLVAWMAGWGDVAIPGPRGGFFTVYILGPVSGGLIGAGLYKLFMPTPARSALAKADLQAIEPGEPIGATATTQTRP